MFHMLVSKFIGKEINIKWQWKFKRILLTVGNISKPILNERINWIVSGGILFVREPIPNTKISIIKKILSRYRKE